MANTDNIISFVAGEAITEFAIVSLNGDGKVIKVCRVKQLHIDKIEYKPVERKESNY